MRLVFDINSGNVLRSTVDAAAPQAGPGEGELNVQNVADPYSLYVLNNEVFAYSADEYDRKRQRPPYSASWSNTEMCWIDGRTVEQARFDKWDEIKRERAVRETSPITVANRTFDATTDSQAKIAGAVQLAQLALMAGEPFSIDWTLADNSVATLTSQELIAIGVALGTRTSAIYSTARTLRAQIDAATTAAEVEAIVWEQ